MFNLIYVFFSLIIPSMGYFVGSYLGWNGWITFLIVYSVQNAVFIAHLLEDK